MGSMQLKVTQDPETEPGIAPIAAQDGQRQVGFHFHALPLHVEE